MKKLSLVFMAIATVLIASSAYADTVSAGTLGNPINLQNDPVYVNTFPSREQTVSDSQDAVFVYVANSGNTVNGGFSLVQSDLFALRYLYRTSAYTVPAAAADGTVNTTGEVMASPLSLVYAAKFGSLLFGFNYEYAAEGGKDVVFFPGGTVNTGNIVNYQLHVLTPGVTLFAGSDLSVDISAPVTLQFLNYDVIAATITNFRSMPLLRSAGLVFQVNKEMSSKLTLALRGNYTYMNTDFIEDDTTLGVNTYTIDNFIGHAMTLTLGMAFRPTDALTVFGDLFGGYSANIDTPAYTSNVDPTTLTKTRNAVATLPPSAKIGLQYTVGNWSFRGYGMMQVYKTIVTSLDPNFTNGDTETSEQTFTYGAGLGIGWAKNGIEINASVEPDILNNTLYAITGAGTGDLFYSLQLNYYFDTGSISRPASEPAVAE